MEIRWASEWLAEQHAASQREFTRLLIASLVAHAVLIAAFAWLPTPHRLEMPAVLTVDLVAAPRPAAPAPAPKAVPKPAPKAVAPPPPRPRPKEIVLPKEAPAAVPKRKPKPAPAPAPVEKLTYDDALSALRDELGEEAEPDAELLETARPSEARPAPAGAGQQAAPAVVRWQRATQQRLRERWVTPPEFLDKNVTTLVQVTLTATGQLVGQPKVVRASGDPYWDENAIRAVLKAAPLPPPPEPGDWTFAFRPEPR